MGADLGLIRASDSNDELFLLEWSPVLSVPLSLGESWSTNSRTLDRDAKRDTTLEEPPAFCPIESPELDLRRMRLRELHMLRDPDCCSGSSTVK